MGIMAQKGPEGGHNRVGAFKRKGSFRDVSVSQGKGGREKTGRGNRKEGGKVVEREGGRGRQA